MSVSNLQIDESWLLIRDHLPPIDTEILIAALCFGHFPSSRYVYRLGHVDADGQWDFHGPHGRVVPIWWKLLIQPPAVPT